MRSSRYGVKRDLPRIPLRGAIRSVAFSGLFVFYILKLAEFIMLHWYSVHDGECSKKL